MRSFVIVFFGLALLVTVMPASVPAADPAVPSGGRPWLWVYAPTNFQVDKNVDELITLLTRAKKAGYTGVLIDDYKFGRLADRPANYYANLKRIRKAAEELGIELIPSVAPIGYSNSLLMNNPNLAEGLAVKDCLFTVKGNQATVTDTENLLPQGDFEKAVGNKFPGWDFVDGPGQSTFQDTAVKHSGAASLRMESFKAGNEAGNCRVSKKLKLLPWHQYHVSLWLRTKDVAPAGEIRVAVLAGKQSLNYANLGVKPTQDWAEHHVVFNTLENSDVSLYVGIWGGHGGMIWLDDLSLCETAGVNLLRREGCPIRVTSEDGRTEYTEGRDFAKWEDPKLGVVPWPGEYEVWHSPPPITISPGSKIKDGQKLHVSFYHTAIIYDEQVSCCLRHEQVYRLIEDQVTQIKKYLAPHKYFMSFDELRLAGQCKLCTGEHKTAGQLLADSVRRCTAIIHKVDPQAEVFVWSDMFDPSHNAHADYYLCGSTLAGSWEGLDRSVRIANWNSGHAAESLKFFADRGHKQLLAAYYDNPDWQKQLAGWLKTGSGLPGIDGVMYTTWQHNYADLEAFAKALPAR